MRCIKRDASGTERHQVVTVFLAKPLVGVDLYSIRPVDHVAALARGSVPLLVIHGEADTTIPVTHARRIAAAYGPAVKTLLVPGADHVRSYESEPQTDLHTVTRFLDEAEKPACNAL